MPTTTITNLPNATVPLSGSERVAMDQAGVTVDAPVSAIAALASAGSSLSDAVPQALGTAAAGSAATASRGDHRHAMPSPADVGAATAAQGALAASAVQPAGLSVYLTSAIAATTYQPLTANLTSLGAQAPSYYLSRQNHTGTQPLSSITGLPTGALVGTTDTQVLGGKTFANFKESVFTITDTAGFVIDPNTSPIQVVTLGANRTPVVANFAAGQSMLLCVDDGTGFAITWTSVGTFVSGGTAPTLPTAGYGLFELFKIGSTINIVYVGTGL